ncbi:BTAD domain-containing putative transcriptional regulator, partial [Amycolatopsis sp. NPDC059090]|uniref:AfsR/SARP family transcriptional regulator n=1 Tax=Amycolatopsis sp. NPDC059090 TaxID=3346723 RepID=UPI00367260D3
MRVGVLGPLEVQAEDGRRVDVGGPRVRALLVRLALDPNRLVAVDSLVDGLWGDAPPGGAVNALQSLVSRLRHALPSGGALVESGAGGYRLAVAPEAVDAYRFERLAADGRRKLNAGNPELAVGPLREALALWRGPGRGRPAAAPVTAAPAGRGAVMRVDPTPDRGGAGRPRAPHPPPPRP